LSVKKFINMSPDKLTDEVAEMCKRLGISGSVEGMYDLYKAVLEEQERAKENFKKTRKFSKQLLKETN